MLRLSYIDLDSDTLQGGKFTRVTPTVNWHMINRARLEVTYGYGILDRFGLRGATLFVQARLQLQLSKLGVVSADCACRRWPSTKKSSRCDVVDGRTAASE